MRNTVHAMEYRAYNATYRAKKAREDAAEKAAENAAIKEWDLHNRTTTIRGKAVAGGHIFLWWTILTMLRMKQ